MTLKEKILSLELTDSQLAMFYMGQEGFLIKFRGKYLLIDGYLTNAIDIRFHKAPEQCRRYPSPLSPNELDFIDWVFCTHVHDDHTDPWTIEGIAKVNASAKFCIPAAFADDVRKMGAENILSLDTDHSYRLCDDISVTPVPAAHEELHPCGNGNYQENGFVFRFGAIQLYHAGDSTVYTGLAERIAGSHILMLPINGRDYFRLNSNCIGNMDSREAILLASLVKPELLIPMHYDLHPGNDLNPAVFVEWIEKMKREEKLNIPYHLFTPGEKYIFTL